MPAEDESDASLYLDGEVTEYSAEETFSVTDLEDHPVHEEYTESNSNTNKSRVCFQWIPSHVGVFGNEEAEVLAKEGSALPSATSSELFTSEMHSIYKAKANSVWKNPPHMIGMPGTVLVCISGRRHKIRSDCIGQVA
ncbi:hypothetical protein AVEN_159787-1 [Araneus ventricosus]|uniref:Uncharacterized protein n=1 Tax=Araneus ventricosus TaxID=182803 RepID=A0A4Y2D9J5_ARAVE|nr:hypothetical protein AVEN_159787-1 [Araneus ventricosus]